MWMFFAIWVSGLLGIVVIFLAEIWKCLDKIAKTLERIDMWERLGK